MVNLVTPKQHLLMPVLFGRAYWKKIINVDAANLIGYWPMNEASGATALDKSAQGNDGAYTGVTLGQEGIGDGFTCPLFDGTNDFNNIYSAGLVADWIGSEYTFSAWARPVDAGVWTDGTQRQVISLYVNTNHSCRVYKGAAQDDVIALRHESANVPFVHISPSRAGDTDWFHLGMRVSETGDVYKSYMDGTLVETDTGLGAWAGALNVDQTNIGCADNTGPTFSWDGYIAHVAIWKTMIAESKLQSLASI